MSQEQEKTAAELALDEIAAMCGAPEWEYPGQVVRDVRALRDALTAARPFVRAARGRKRVDQRQRAAAEELYPKLERLLGSE